MPDRPSEPERDRPSEPETVWVRCLVDPHDAPEFAAELEGEAARAAGILLVRLNPLTRTPSHLARDVLAALGVEIDHLQRQRPRTNQLPGLAQAQLCGHDVRDLVFDRGNWLSNQLLTEARRWCAYRRIAVWLIAPEPLPGAEPARRDALTRNIRLGHLRGTTATLDRRTRPRPADRHGDWPPELADLRLPTDGFLTFRTACARLLPEAFEAIDTVYRDTILHIESTRAAPHPPPPLEHAIAALHHALTIDDPPAPVRLIRLRAAQAILFRAAALVLNWQPPTARAHPLDLPGTLITTQHIGRLRRLADPSPATANLLAGLLETGPAELNSLHRFDITDSGDDLRINAGGAPIDIPATAQPIVRAHLCRIDHQARPGPHPTPLFRTAVASHLREVDEYYYPRDTAPVTLHDLADFPRPFPTRWLQRRHLQLTQLPPPSGPHTANPAPDRRESRP